ncbi:efflux RND transporter periplasmic adaptor subunit [Botrimarina hoheduenensis]|uniref:HlyD family secretion protein n=1 Tax=Botrimarina hoheduenensis TaxID=2528000 RepID=A0A5C5VZZ0_9BACT|nr:efflux RND transporter periplasmic adaptor subunit [Botrimarina hoheduenensis]TWT43495.1 HlyD family secretion protein [Botrimarina hoheduenensis]
MSNRPRPARLTRVALITGALLAIGATAYVTTNYWLPYVGSFVPKEDQVAGAPADDPHAGHDHEGHTEAASIELSDKGLKNIGYVPLVIQPTEYARTLSLPAIVVERPGRSQKHVTAPFTGLVTDIYAVNGEAVGPNEPLFEMKLTHEELVTAQTDYLQTQANLEVVNRELARLQGLGKGVIAGKRILEQQYEKQRLESALMAGEQALLLHGLAQEQVDDIRKTQQLFRSITVFSPEHRHSDEACEGPHLFTVQRLGIAEGEQIEVGRELAVLADHCALHVEATAFEDDAAAIRSAAREDRSVTARLLQSDSEEDIVQGLEVLYVADQIDPQSRALKVFFRLPNQVAYEKSLPGGKRFLEWRFKPGQRLQVSIPVETWDDQLVVLTTAVVDEGGESYVYRQNGDHFDQVPVHVVHRDQNAIVIANDGALFPGDVVAGQGAFQMHLALKNQAGGGVDPHAGHNH